MTLLIKDIRPGDYFVRKHTDGSDGTTDVVLKNEGTSILVNLSRGRSGTQVWGQADLYATVKLGWSFHRGMPDILRLPIGV